MYYTSSFFFALFRTKIIVLANLSVILKPRNKKNGNFAFNNKNNHIKP